MKYFENYKDVKETKPTGLRGHIRNVALDGLAIFNQIQDPKQILEKPRVQFLYIHHVFKDEEHKLDALLKKLSLNHTFISYSDAVTKILENKIDKSYICISSDDGFKNNLAAAEIMNEYGAKGCFFINPSIIGNSSFIEIEKHCRTRLNFPPVEFMDWNDIEQLQKWGHEIGSHTMEHINVANSEKELFMEDCNKTFDILMEKCGDVKHFAFPYGRFFHFNEMGREVVFNSGFSSCATAERGCHINDVRTLAKEELCILRDHVVLDWNINHIIYFLINNSKHASFKNNLFPYNK
jgi:peptidoglycan/xylan/chitin deacetylase (PgdA/CDA1 family)